MVTEQEIAIARVLVGDQLSGKKNFDEACKRVGEMIETYLPNSKAVIEFLIKENQEEVRKRERLREKGGDTSVSRDLFEAGWYTGPKKTGVWNDLRERMASNGLSDALSSIDISTDAIVSSLAEPYVYDAKRKGLVIGNVQSGKTANFSAVIAKAIDEKYRFVLVLSGIHNNLRKQTQERLERDLNMTEDSHDWYRLTDPDGDFGRAQIKNAGAILSQNQRIVAVVKKNGSRLRNVLDFLKSVDARTLEKTPILIIDDESDQATPDSSPKPDNDPTKINQLMREIWAEVNNGTYVGYTATPFANILMDPNSGKRAGELEQLYPQHFIHVMPTPKAYFGAERIFGLDGSSEHRLPDIVRAIPQDELEFLAPSKEGSPEITETLENAIRWFIIAAAIRRTRSQGQKHSTMLIHTTHRVAPHFEMRDEVVAFLDPLRRAAREEDVDSFRSVFHEERDRAAELYVDGQSAPSWQQVSAEIPNVLRTLKVSVDNGSADSSDRLSYPEDSPQTVIVIGGGTLSRGLTLEGLFVSFFTRTSSTYDTLLQMGRWFGYRIGYEDLQRVWLSPGLEDDYRFLATVEEDVREEIRRMAGSKQTPEEIGVRVLLHPGRLQITSAAKMKFAKVAQADFEGMRLQTTLFDMSKPEVHERNIQVAIKLRSALEKYRSESDSALYTDVPVEELAEFFGEFEVHPRFQENFTSAYRWTSEKLPSKNWNVVIPDSDGTHDFKLITRTPIVSANSSDSSVINIRSLMSDGDILRDLKGFTGKEPSVGRGASHAKQLNERQNKDGLDGRGLLIIYPISRFSKAKESSEREDMNVALARVAPSLTEKPNAPLLGVAYVAPWDTQHELSDSDRGMKVSVSPEFSETVIEHEDIDDKEGSYAG